jgi:hypothetical protein
MHLLEAGPAKRDELVDVVLDEAGQSPPHSQCQNPPFPLLSAAAERDRQRPM